MTVAWKKYPEKRLVFEHEEGYFVIVPEEKTATSSSPVFCPVCTKMTTSQYDELSYEKFKCCDDCANTWAYARKDDWMTGWRPSKEEVEKVVTSRCSRK